MTHSPVVAPRQVELLVSSLSGTIGATIDSLFVPVVRDGATTGPGYGARRSWSTKAVAGQ